MLMNCEDVSPRESLTMQIDQNHELMKYYHDLQKAELKRN
jgi:hypothetical protein